LTSGPVIVVGGPTASGKSGLALRIAQEFGGEIVNADSMQVYRDLRIVTARPPVDDEISVPHHLYGTLGLRERSSAGSWCETALAVVRRCHDAGAIPVVVGGTGLYLRALMTGLNRMPAVPPEIRETLNARLRKDGPGILHGELAAIDPESADRLNPADGQRIVRALEIFQHTGKPLSDWQSAETNSAPTGLRFFTIVTAPPHEDLYAAINDRFDRMLEAGAVKEVETLLAAGPDEDFPPLKAVGVPPIRAFVEGGIDRDRMRELGKRDTRRYAKRQGTWFRHQIIPHFTLETKLSEKTPGKIFPEISDFLLTP
jgi:tRNA dimethylallyltransferase